MTAEGAVRPDLDGAGTPRRDEGRGLKVAIATGNKNFQRSPVGFGIEGTGLDGRQAVAPSSQSHPRRPSPSTSGRFSGSQPADPVFSETLSPLSSPGIP